MKNWQIKLSLFLNYFVFAILLNSVGTVILQVQNNFGIMETDASILEACKDLSIAVMSFLAALFFYRLGYKLAMMIGLAIVTIACFMIPAFPCFLATKLMFVAIGVSFALIKMSVYSTIGLVTNSDAEHISLMNFIESFFMIGILTGNFIFAEFVNPNDATSTTWFNVYYLIGGLSFLALILLYFAPLDESEVKRVENKGSVAAPFFNLLSKPVVLIFVVCAFFFVLIEQSIMNWLPTFNYKVLQMPSNISIQVAAIMAFSIALGRFLAGFISRKINWYYMLTGALIFAAMLVLGILPLANGVNASGITSFFQAPFVAFIFPMIGLLLAPIYPAINSLILNTLPKEEHSVMANIIIVFSALGGTLGSRITGFIFQNFGGTDAFYFSLVPITILLIALFFFKRVLGKQS